MIILLVLLLVFWVPLILYVYATYSIDIKHGGRTDRVMEKKYKFTLDTDVDILDNTYKMLASIPYLNELIKEAKTCIEYTDIPRREKYRSTRGTFRTTLHNGQLKLLLTEIQFLTLCLKSSLEKAYVVYAGSAPSHKLGVLMTMFPNVQFILVDPNEHLIMYPTYSQAVETQYDTPEHVGEILYFRTAAGNRFDLRNRPIKTRKGVIKRGEKPLEDVTDDIAQYIIENPHKIYIIEDYMTNQLAEKFAGLPNLYFISDIRSVSDEGMPTDADLIWNSAMQYNWIARMKPQRYMLKYHPPYGKEIKFEYHMQEAINQCPIDLSLRDGKWTYLKAEHIFVQAYAPYTSSETRLIGSTLDTQEYDIHEYEDKFFYYNNIHRNTGRHTSHLEYIDYDIGVDYCGDCAIMCHIIAEYTNKYAQSRSRDTVLGFIKTILRSIDRDLRTKASLHAVCTVQYEYVASPLQVIKHAFITHIARSFSTKYRRLQDRPTPYNQVYRSKIKDKLPPIIAKYKFESTSGLSDAPNGPNIIAKAIYNSITTYDIYGDSREFFLDILSKCYGVFNDPQGITNDVINVIMELESENQIDKRWTGDETIVKHGCRMLSKGDIELCTSISHNDEWSYRNKQLDVTIDDAINRYKLEGVVEICTMRTDTYFDNITENYIAPRTVDNTSYEAHCFYGGEQLRLDAKYGNRLIIINLHGLSIAMILAVYNMVSQHNSAPIIILSRWDYINKHGQLLTDMSCNVNCQIKGNCTHLFINRINFD